MARKSDLEKTANKARRDFEANTVGQKRGTTCTGQSPFQAMKAAQLAAESEGKRPKATDPRFGQLAQSFEQQVQQGMVDPGSRKRWLRSATETRLFEEREAHGDVYSKATGNLT